MGNILLPFDEYDTLNELLKDLGADEYQSCQIVFDNFNGLKREMEVCSMVSLPINNLTATLLLLEHRVPSEMVLNVLKVAWIPLLLSSAKLSFTMDTILIVYLNQYD